MSDLGKYARLERERRWLLASAPATPTGARSLQLADRYLHSTRLRLRTVLVDGEAPVHKLGQKVAVRADPSAVAHTTLCLSPAEFALLERLPADQLAKTRTLVLWGELVLAVDVFAGPLAGLVLAEVDLGETDRDPGVLPYPAIREVTGDSAFSGAALAVLTRDGLRQLVGSGIEALG